ncbi:hypothetical protein [Neorhizobium galegae]|uniref:hypothetical protein n=1 Tax=Neorhizobium galegae TaxID=399 RepID=UPI0006214A5E|nr:hypothetical protein [Neorhizobium galegae]CDZ55098.1 Hypothetical protein NGAL_HAMBI2427_60000 [Neorhizobium galegae bv. orientalis]
MQVATTPVNLAAAVASPAGTVTVPYPTGYAQADFTGVNALATAYLLLNNNDRFTEVADQFDISYGASNATITNKTGFTWSIGTELLVSFAKIGASDAVTALTDSSGGTASNTIVDVPAAYAEATLANQLASLTAKVNTLVAAHNA